MAEWKRKDMVSENREFREPLRRLLWAAAMHSGLKALRQHNPSPLHRWIVKLPKHWPLALKHSSSLPHHKTGITWRRRGEAKGMGLRQTRHPECCWRASRVVVCDRTVGIVSWKWFGMSVFFALHLFQRKCVSACYTELTHELCPPTQRIGWPVQFP